MATVKGIWFFNGTITQIPTEETVDFSVIRADGSVTNYIGMRLYNMYLSYKPNAYQVHNAHFYGNSSWVEECFRTVDFGTTEQTVSDDFYTWLTANAVQQGSDPSEPTTDILYTVNGSSLTAVANAIRGKTGTTGELAFPDGFVSAVEEIQTESSPKIQPLSITENGTYEAPVGVDGYSPVTVAIESGGGGEVTPPTTPTDGKTRVYIHLEYGRTSPMLGVCPNGTVTVDWGDGTKPDTLTGTSTTTVKWTPTHEYTAPGDYVIALTVEGTMGFYGNSSGNQYSGILRYASGTDTRNRVYQSAVQKVEIGEGVTSIGNSAFYNCSSLASITIPESVTSIGNYAFYSCSSLASITIPEGVTSIGNYAFYSCSSLASITIPENVTSIGKNAFKNCYGMRYYDFTASASVPVLPSTNAFSGIPSDCQMLIPAALYDEWSAATNWATYASYMVAV